MSKYIIRYAARLRYDGYSSVESFDQKKDLSALIRLERRAAKASNSYFEVEERFPAIYSVSEYGFHDWMCDCADLKKAKRILNALNKE